MNPKVTTLAKTIEGLNEANRAAFDAEDAERVKNPEFNMSAEAVAAVKDRNKKIEVLDNELAELSEIEGIRSATSSRRSALAAPVRSSASEAIHSGAPGAPAGRARRPRSIGERFTSSEEWTSFLAKYPNGLPQRGIHSDPVEIGSFLPARNAVDLPSIDDLGTGSLTGPDLQPDIARTPFPITGIFDVISRRTTNSDLVEFFRQTSRSRNAAVVPEATTSTEGADSALNTIGRKPQSDFGLQLVQVPVRTVAHWAAVTRRALADLGQLRGVIDDELRLGLVDALADMVINGDGTGDDFKGLAEMTHSTDGVTEQGFVTDLLVTTRKARTAARVQGLVLPNAYVMSPQTWEDIELSKDSQQRFYFAAPQSISTPRLWGLPVIEDAHVPDSVIITGDLTQATLWDRLAAQLYVTDSHADFFTRNIIAILAEQRLAFGVRRPAGIVIVDSGDQS